MLNTWQNSSSNLVDKDFWQLDVTANCNKIINDLFEQNFVVSNEVQNKKSLMYKHISGLLIAKQYPFGGCSNRQTKGTLQMFSRPPKR